jgi:hypothetical protein
VDLTGDPVQRRLARSIRRGIHRTHLWNEIHTATCGTDGDEARKRARFQQLARRLEEDDRAERVHLKADAEQYISHDARGYAWNEKSRTENSSVNLSAGVSWTFFAVVAQIATDEVSWDESYHGARKDGKRTSVSNDSIYPSMLCSDLFCERIIPLLVPSDVFHDLNASRVLRCDLDELGGTVGWIPCACVDNGRLVLRCDIVNES